ncbi:MAG: hypothetical protein ABJB47_11605 [Actinomycetota bacterium]
MSGEDAAWRDLVARFDLPSSPAGVVQPWPEREDLPPARHSDPRRAADPPDGPGPEAGTKAGTDQDVLDGPAEDDPGAADGLGADSAITDRRRVIRPATPAPLPELTGEDDEEEEHFIPPPPPPLPTLDPVAKGAWTALFGGPAFLLVTTTAGITIPGWATFGAVAAFVGGFAMVVARMGDRPSRGSGPDNGAVL